MHPVKVLAVLAVVCLLALVVSSPSKYPSDTEVRTQVTKSLSQEFADLGDLAVDFQKITAKDDGAVATIEYTLTFDRSFADYVRQWEKKTPASGGFAAKSMGMEVIELRKRFGEFKAGDTYSRRQDFLFKRVDGDWQLQG